MQLYGSYTSPFVRHCRIALIETGLECEFVEADAKISAEKSPTQKLPFLHDGELVLTDSNSILRHIRERAGQRFFDDITDYDHFLLVNTAMDACVNLFMLEKDGLGPEQSAYLGRQRRRIDTCVAALEQLPLPSEAPYGDMQLRLACFMDWCLYRQRLDFAHHTNLSDFLAGARGYTPFVQTAPPA